MLNLPTSDREKLSDSVAFSISSCRRTDVVQIVSIEATLCRDLVIVHQDWLELMTQLPLASASSALEHTNPS